LNTISYSTPKRLLGLLLVTLAIAIFFISGLSFLFVQSVEVWLLLLAVTSVLFILGFFFLWLDHKQQAKDSTQKFEDACKHMREFNKVLDYFEAYAANRYSEILPVKAYVNQGVWEATVWVERKEKRLYFDEISKKVKEKD